MIKAFGSLEQVLASSPEALTAACPEDTSLVDALVAAREMVVRSLNEQVVRSRVDPSDPALHAYVSRKLRRAHLEEMHAIYLDRDNGFICDETVSLGFRNSVEFRLTPLVRRAVERGAAGLILVHNHPSAKPQPSAQDVRTTREIQNLLNCLGIDLVDHLIVAGRAVFSMRAAQMY